MSFQKEIEESRYLLLELNNYKDSEVINILDIYLYRWLYRKDQCPICGDCDE